MSLRRLTVEEAVALIGFIGVGFLTGALIAVAFEVFG